MVTGRNWNWQPNPDSTTCPAGRAETGGPLTPTVWDSMDWEGDPLSSSSWHNEEELPLGAELTVNYKISTLRHQPLNCRQEENSTGSNTYVRCGQVSIPAGHRPGQLSLTDCLGRASPSTWHPDGEKKKASQLPKTDCSCCWVCKLQQKHRVLLLYYWRAGSGKALELRIAKTEPLIIPRAWCQLKNQQDRFPLFPRLAHVLKSDRHQTPYLQKSPAEAIHYGC